jgi:hypothetical protein
LRAAIRHSPLATRNCPYDGNRNMTVIDGLTSTWDFKDRLVSVENPEVRADYSYDYTDRRITKSVAYKPGFTNHVSRITSLYVDKFFEAREHDAPTKYVWNGNTRVARVTGSLNTNLRVQSLRVWKGWNLRSLAVNGTNALAQMNSFAPTGGQGQSEGGRFNLDVRCLHQLLARLPARPAGPADRPAAVHRPRRRPVPAHRRRPHPDHA